LNPHARSDPPSRRPHLDNHRTPVPERQPNNRRKMPPLEEHVHGLRSQPAETPSGKLSLIHDLEQTSSPLAAQGPTRTGATAHVTDRLTQLSPGWRTDGISDWQGRRSG
jgi:hypothetical protein